MRKFTELVDDARLFTARRNFARECGSLPLCWDLRTDENRFRAGPNQASKSAPNVVFLGDSVPFGWGVSSRDAVPALFYEQMSSRSGARLGVINAALPSYSMNQALARYRAEIDGKFPVKAVVLQTYDPAAQFALWGRRWKPESAWLSFDVRAAKLGFLGAVLRRSFVVNAWRLADLTRSRLDPADTEALARFEDVNRASLEDFARALRSKKIALVLLPVNPADAARLSAAERNAVRALNGVLQDVAKTEGAQFLDVGARFDRLGSRGLFIDNCCHLSPRGAREQARFVFDAMRSAGLL